MPGDFDAYWKWLGIRPAEQPPHHYRLLGIAAYESNPDVIENAADRQMAHVRRYQNSEHAMLSQNLLNELAAARICLLNLESKKAYDERLRAMERSRKKPVRRETILPPPPPATEPQERAMPVVAKESEERVPTVEPGKPSAALHAISKTTRRRRTIPSRLRRRSPWPRILVLAMLLIIVLTVAYAVWQNGLRASRATPITIGLWNLM